MVPMATALFKKSWRDLSQKKARTGFTIATVALAVMGLSLFGLGPMADMAAFDQIETENLYNIQISVTDVDLDEDNIRELEQIDNVKALEPKTLYATRMYIGERRNMALFIGIEDLSDQQVDKITKTSGGYPGHMEVLADRSNSINGVYDGKAGDTFETINHTGANVPLKITGEGKSLAYSGNTLEGTAVFYGNVETVREIGNMSGYNRLSFDCKDADRDSLDATTEDIRDYLVAETTVVAFARLPDLRSDDEWPGADFLGVITSLISILTILAVLCSVFLISNTMNTIITEQRKEIAQMKAIGASKAQVFRSFLTTSFFIGTIGAVIGAVLGIVMANIVLGTLGDPFGFEPSFQIHLPTMLFSLAIGIALVIGASLPALIRSGKVTVREGLQSHGISANYGEGAMDKALMRFKSLPRVIQMGLRNVARKKGRSAATMLQVALAVGLLLGLVAFGNSLTVATTTTWDNNVWDIAVYGQGSNRLTSDMGPSFETIDGVKETEPFIDTGFQIGEDSLPVVGYIQDTSAWDIEETMDKGRWFSDGEHTSEARVMVIGPALSVRKDLDVDDSVQVMTATGLKDFKVVGITDSLQNNGLQIFTPLSTLADILGTGANVSGFFIFTNDSDDEKLIDRTTTAIEDEMEDRGFTVVTQIQYVQKQQNVEQNQGILTLLLMISVVIILISLIGLISTLTMNIMDRTKEIGMMRCIGAKSRDIRRMFSTEGVFIAFMGWVVGIPMGVFISWFISYMGSNMMDIEVPFTFP
ncbi:MAG: FtsX-like permease family protein, partial [Thermoplasmata archaeon]|nr:FtsX-like permease family protein [Thermoplasmata archaeon]